MKGWEMCGNKKGCDWESSRGCVEMVWMYGKMSEESFTKRICVCQKWREQGELGDQMLC